MERRYAKELQERTAEEATPDVDPDRETDRMESVDVRAFAAPPAHTEARLTDPAHAPERAPDHQASERTARDRQAHDRRAGHQPPDRQSHERRSGERPAEQVPPRVGVPLRCGRRRARPARPALPGPRAAQADHRRPLPGLHPRSGRRGGRRPRLPVGARRARRAAEHVHRASARPGTPPVRLHHGPPPGRGRGTATAREPPPQAPARGPRPRRARRRLRSAPPGAGADAHGLPPGGRPPRPRRADGPRGVGGPAARARPRPGRQLGARSRTAAHVCHRARRPRATGGVEVGDPETWSAARSSTAEPSQTGTSHPTAPSVDPAPRQRTNQSRRNRDRGRTPLFDQYDDEDRPRAANE